MSTETGLPVLSLAKFGQPSDYDLLSIANFQKKNLDAQLASKIKQKGVSDCTLVGQLDAECTYTGTFSKLYRKC